MSGKGKRVERLARKALEKGYITEAQLHEFTSTDVAETDLTAIHREGLITHRQLAEIRDADRAGEPLVSADDHEPGEPVGRYILLKPLGAGGMGTVWLASDTSLDRFVAVKFLRDIDPEDRARFEREARLAARLNHPGIASVFEYDAGERPYLVMQFVEGKSLMAIVTAAGLLPEPRAIRIGLQVSEALECLHRNGLTHRDIKPENLILTEHAAVKLCDFGLAKSSKGLDPGLTMPGHILGTPSFMSPEQIRGKGDVDIRTDLYSLGCTMFFMVAGHPPFQGSSIGEILDKHLGEPAPDLRGVRPEVSPPFASLVSSLLAKNPEQRTQTPAELAEALRRLESPKAEPLPKAPARGPASKEKASTRKHLRSTRRRFESGAIPRWLPWAAGAAILLLALVALSQCGR